MPVLTKDIKDLADFLKLKRSTGEHVALFLGHRTGILYTGKLYEELKNYTKRAKDLFEPMNLDTSVAKELFKWIQYIEGFTNSPNSDSFKKCYSILGKYFNENGVHTILSNALKSTSFREEDKLIAKFIRAKFFDTIVTTNFDTLLEDACSSAEIGMEKSEKEKSGDYGLFIYGSDVNSGNKVEQNSSRCGQIVKIFGDINTREVKTAGHEFNLEADTLIKKFLESTLAKDIVVLGYDPTWDKPIEQAFTKTNRMLWYVNEQKPATNTHLAEVLKESPSRFIGGPGLTYEFFLHTLYGIIGENVSWKPEMKVSSPLALSQESKRNKVFISYSHANKRYLKRLKTHLEGLQHVDNDDMNIKYGEVWDDTKTPPGHNWMEEIKEALAHAKVAVLLLSPEFFASNFIYTEELPILQEAAQAHKVEIISVLLGPTSVFKHTSLKAYQCINNESEFLMKLTPHQQDGVWDRLIEHIFFKPKDTN